VTDVLLRANDICAGYSEAVVLDGVSFDLAKSQAMALLGRNGVGKTTLVLTLMGLTRLIRGTLQLDDVAFEKLPTNDRVGIGLGWVPQERAVFPSLTVEENLRVAARPDGAWPLERVYALFPEIADRRANYGNQLSGGEQQMVAIARALVTGPKVLLLDEPTEGLAPLIIDRLIGAFLKLRDTGIGLVLVEQQTTLALELTEHAIVLDRGRTVYSGPSATLRGDTALLARSLGLASKDASA